jgi:hypothetical protein
MASIVTPGIAFTVPAPELNQFSSEIADDIAAALRSTEAEDERRRQDTGRQLEQRRHTIVSKLDRGYDDYVTGKISDGSGRGNHRNGRRRCKRWTRNGGAWSSQQPR